MVWTPRATVACVVEKEGKFLMVEEMVKGEIVLNQPAGHIDQGESILAAAVRETLEETAWTVELEHIVGFYTSTTPTGVTYHRFAFAAKALSQDIKRPLDYGIIAPRWLTLEEIKSAPNLRSPTVLQVVQDYLAGHNYPLSLIVEALE